MTNKDKIAALRESFDIYLNGNCGVKHNALDMLTTWKKLLPVCREWGESLLDFLRMSLAVALVIVAPFLVVLAPIIAIFTAHKLVSEEEMRARMRRNLHRNGADKS